MRSPRSQLNSLKQEKYADSASRFGTRDLVCDLTVGVCSRQTEVLVCVCVCVAEPT